MEGFVVHLFRKYVSEVFLVHEFAKLQSQSMEVLELVKDVSLALSLDDLWLFILEMTHIFLHLINW
jgi:hypothetical protein